MTMNNVQWRAHLIGQVIHPDVAGDTDRWQEFRAQVDRHVQGYLQFDSAEQMMEEYEVFKKLDI